MTRSYFIKIQKPVAALLLAGTLFSFAIFPFLALPETAHASVPVHESQYSVIRHKEVEAASAVVSFFSWDGFLNLITSTLGAMTSFDSISTALIKLIIVVLRDTIITFIKTGRWNSFEYWVKDYIDDQQQILEGAADFYLNQVLTAYQTCPFFDFTPTDPFIKPPLPDLAGLIPRKQIFDCSLISGAGSKQEYWDFLYTALTEPETVPIEDYALLDAPENDYFRQQLALAADKNSYERMVLFSRELETVLGEGYLAARDIAGLIQSPGTLIAEPVRQAIASDFRGIDVADEVSDAVASIITVLANTLMQKLISGL